MASNNLTTTAPAADLAELSDRARDYAKASASTNTRRAYAAQLKLWQAWTDRHGKPLLPAAPADVASWLAERADAGQSISTLRTAIAALRAGHHAAGHSFDTAHPTLKNVIKGIARQTARPQRQAEPLRGADILDIIGRIGTKPIDKRDAAILALGYIAGLRRSELVGLDLDRLGNGDGFVRITSRSIEITLARSKTNAAGETDVVSIPREPNAEAIRAIEAWIRDAAIEPGTPLFRPTTKGGAVQPSRLEDQAVAHVIKKRIILWLRRKGAPKAQAEADAKAFAGHSLRVGFAVTAAEAGADLRAIASVTRHRSLQMPARYAKKAEQLRTSPHNLAGVGLKR